MISDVILKVAAMEYAEEEEKPYYPRPSIAGPDRCLRQMVYWARGEERKPLSGRAVMVFNDSSWAEELTFDLMRKSAFQVHSEQMPITIQNAFPWMPEGTWRCKVCDKDVPYRAAHGHLDALASDMLGNDYLIEHKALSMFGFEALWKGDVAYGYLSQMAFYFRGLQQDNPDLTKGVLLVKNKNQSGYLEYIVTYDNSTDTLTVLEIVHHTGERKEVGLVIPSITNDAIARFAEVEKHRAAKTLPAREYTLEDWQCGYCSYSATCWAGWAEEHSRLAEDVALEGEISDLLRYEREVQLHEASAKREREELKEKIKAILAEKGVRSGRTQDYVVEWSVTKTKKFDKDLLPPGVYAAAQKDMPVEKLSIRKIKKEKAHE